MRHAVPRILRCTGASVLLSVALLKVPAAHGAGQDGRTTLNATESLADLVELASHARGVSIRFDPSKLTQSVTVRTPERGLTDDELWDLMQRALANANFATVQEPGDSMLSIVTLAEAGKASRVERGDLAASQAGFASVLVVAQHEAPEDLVTSIGKVLPDASEKIERVGDGSLLLISARRAWLEQALWMLDRLDQPSEQPVLRRITPQYVSADSLATDVTTVLNSLVAAGAARPSGQLSVMPSGRTALLIAPESELDEWMAYIDDFDVPQPIETQTYRPRSFTLDEVLAVIEETARIDGPAGSGEQWNVRVNQLTGSLIVTASPREHEQIRDTLAQLETVPGADQNQMRRIVVRNRQLEELHDTLAALLDAGALGMVEGASAETDSTPDISSPSISAPVTSDRDREDTRPGVQSMTAGGITIVTDPGTNSLVVMGPPRLVEQIESLVKDLDVREPQVMLEVLIVSLNETDLFDLGVELERLEVSSGTIFDLRSLFGLSSGDGGDTANPSVGRGDGFTGLVLDPGNFSVVVRALESISEGRTLVMPKVLVNNNEQTLLDSVRREPFQSTNSNSTVATTSFGGDASAGTQITLTPQIAAGDHLLLEYDVSLSAFIGDAASASVPPPQQENNIQSKVTVPNGHTIVLGGLESRSSSEAETRIPFLGEIPLLGELFKSRSRNESVDRFYVFIKPTILRHGSFEDLKYMSAIDQRTLGLDGDWPEVTPRLVE